MRRRLITVLSAATTVAALGVPACSGPDRSSPTPGSLTPPAPVIAAPPVDPGPLPPPEALTAVMYRLADPAVPGADKLLLVQDTAPVDAATFETFAAALRDGGFTPITFTATDIRPPDTRPDDVLATIGVTTSNPDDPGEFSFPMEFRTGGDGWQLTRETADMLLAFGSTRGGADLPAPPGPPR